MAAVLIALTLALSEAFATTSGASPSGEVKSEVDNEEAAPAATPKSAATGKRAREEERGWPSRVGRSVVDGGSREERRGRSETRIEERFPSTSESRSHKKKTERKDTKEAPAASSHPYPKVHYKKQDSFWDQHRATFS